MAEQKLTALIVDDDPDILAYQGTLLEALGFRVEHTKSVRGLAPLLKRNPDLILIDLMLPERDGVQVLQAFASAKVSSAIVLTSAAQDRVLNAAESVARMSGLNILGYLRKPVWEEDLKRVIDPLIERKLGDPAVEEEELRRLATSGNLLNHYQPVIDAQRATVHSVEALSRLHHPKLGVISPSSLWETAEIFSAATELQTKLLDVAIEDSQRMAERGHRIVVSCNVPPEQVAATDFADRMLSRCREAGVLSSSIALEVDEANIRNNFLATLTSLTRLALRGMQVTVDDYGSGSLTPAMLSRLPCSELKVGMHLVQAAAEDAEARARIIDLVDYAHRQEIRIVAKGVESPEQLGLLMDLGVSHFQGFLFSEPRAFEEIVYWLKSAPQRLAELGLTSQLRQTGEQPAVP